MPNALYFTDDDAANRFLAEDPLALLIGMLLDQQIQMEVAFKSPHLLAERLGGSLDAGAIAAMDEDDVVAAFREKPALHRFPASMAKRTQALCATVAADYGGDAARIWTEAENGEDLYGRLRALPGFGDAKARIFVGVVGKRLGEGPDGWEEAAATWPSIADVGSFDDVATLREQKRAMKAAGKKA